MTHQVQGRDDGQEDKPEPHHHVDLRGEGEGVKWMKVRGEGER